MSRDVSFIMSPQFVRKSPLITDLEVVKQKMELLDTLLNVEIANELLKVLYNWFQELIIFRTGMLLIKTLSIILIFDLKSKTFSKLNVTENKNDSNLGNSLTIVLLWHGSRLSNWVGILSQGLRIAPPTWTRKLWYGL